MYFEATGNSGVVTIWYLDPAGIMVRASFSNCPVCRNCTFCQFCFVSKLRNWLSETNYAGALEEIVCYSDLRNDRYYKPPRENSWKTRFVFEVGHIICGNWFFSCYRKFKPGPSTWFLDFGTRMNGDTGICSCEEPHVRLFFSTISWRYDGYVIKYLVILTFTLRTKTFGPRLWIRKHGRIHQARQMKSLYSFISFPWTSTVNALKQAMLSDSLSLNAGQRNIPKTLSTCNGLHHTSGASRGILLRVFLPQQNGRPTTYCKVMKSIESVQDTHYLSQ